MQSTPQKILIDPVDTKVLVPDVYDAEATFLDAANHVSYHDATTKANSSYGLSRMVIFQDPQTTQVKAESES